MTTQLDLFTRHRTGEYEVPQGKVEHCRSCGASIVWANTPKGRAVPLSLATVQEHDGKRYALSHFTDCPQAKEWSKKR